MPKSRNRKSSKTRRAGAGRRPPDRPYRSVTRQMTPAHDRAVEEGANAELLGAGDQFPPPLGPVDVWPCLGAAVLDPAVVMGLVVAGGPSDVPALEGLSALLAEPAAAVCRNLALEIAHAA